MFVTGERSETESGWSSCQKMEKAMLGLSVSKTKKTRRGKKKPYSSPKSRSTPVNGFDDIDRKHVTRPINGKALRPHFGLQAPRNSTQFLIEDKEYCYTDSRTRRYSQETVINMHSPDQELPGGHVFDIESTSPSLYDSAPCMIMSDEVKCVNDSEYEAEWVDDTSDFMLKEFEKDYHEINSQSQLPKEDHLRENLRRYAHISKEEMVTHYLNLEERLEKKQLFFSVASDIENLQKENDRLLNENKLLNTLIGLL